MTGNFRRTQSLDRNPHRVRSFACTGIGSAFSRLALDICSPMQQFHKDNHYVPQLYLKQWATGAVVQTYSLLVGHERVPPWKARSLKGIAFHQHLYTNIVNGVESDDLERWLDSEFEAPAAGAIDLVVKDQRLSPEQWRNLVRFAVAQDVRTPARLKHFLQRQANVMPAMLDGVLSSAVAKLESGDLPPASEEADSGNGFPLRVVINRLGEEGGGTVGAETIVGRSMWHWTIRHLLTSTIDKIPMKGWTILKPAHGYKWPTSDSPLIRLRYTDEVSYDFAGGWRSPMGDLILPISPEHLLHRCDGVRPRVPGSRLDEATTRKIIRVIIEHADRYVFSKNPFSVEHLRKRRVCAETMRTERDFWKTWNMDQLNAERGYSK